MAKRKKQKQRVAFRKNREKRARRGNLTRDVDMSREDDERAAQIADLPTGERLVAFCERAGRRGAERSAGVERQW